MSRLRVSSRSHERAGPPGCRLSSGRDAPRHLHDVQSFRGVRNPARSQNARFSLAHRLAATFPGAGNGMSAMRVLRFASAARAGSGIEAVPLATDEVRVDVFGRRPGAPCSDTANTSVPWEESLQDTTRLYPSPGDCLGS